MRIYYPIKMAPEINEESSILLQMIERKMIQFMEEKNSGSLLIKYLRLAETYGGQGRRFTNSCLGS